jgi:hypothetical protein
MARKVTIVEMMDQQNDGGNFMHMIGLELDLGGINRGQFTRKAMESAKRACSARGRTPRLF